MPLVKTLASRAYRQITGQLEAANVQAYFNLTG